MSEPSAPDHGMHAPVLAVLVLLVVLSPWPFGSAHWSTTAAIAIVGLLVSLLGGIASLRGGGARLSLPRAAAPALGLWVLGLAQLAPLPRAALRLVAAGPAAVWYPAQATAAAVMGAGFRPISLHPDATLRWLAFSAAVLALALAARPALRSRSVLLRSAVAVVLGAVLVAVYGLVARLAFGDRLFGVLAVPTITPFGPFVSKNHFAGYVEMAACLALGLAVGLADEARHAPEWLSWLDSRRAAWIVAAFGGAAVLVLAVPVSLSRGGVVSLAAGLFTFTVVRLSTRRAALPWAAAALVPVALAIAFVLPQEARLRVRTVGETDPSRAYRLSAWRDSLHLAASSPLLGSGFGAYTDALPRFKTAAGDMRIEHAENDYLELVAESGLVGAVLGGLALAWALSTALHGVRDETHRLARGVRIGALAGLGALAVHSAVDFNLRLPSNALLAAFLLACALAPADAGEPQPEETTLARRSSRYAFVAVVVAALLVSCISPWADRRLDLRSLQRAASATSDLRAVSLEASLAAHLARRPADASAWLALAWLRMTRSPAEAAALGAWALQLDPLDPGLRRAAEPVMAATSSPAPGAASSRASAAPRSGH